MKVIKDILREMWHSKVRELYIFIMILLGISTFIGLNMTNVDINKTVNNYRVEKNIYDLKIIGDISKDKIKELEDVEVEGVYTDYFTVKDDTKVVNISSINEKISKPILLSGRMPSKENEVIISQIDNEYKIGDTIKLEKKDKYMEFTLKNTELEVVGIFENSEHISNSIKEIVNVGDSLVKIFILAKEDLFNMEKYNLYRIKFNELDNINFTGEKYKNELNNKIEDVKKVMNNKDIVYSSILDNSSIVSFKDSVKTIDTLRILFPIVFFMVVILVCSSNLTRMILDQRRTIGTYKFLGYENSVIYLKYMLIAIIPTILSIIPGIFIGVYSFPKLFYSAFSADLINEVKTLSINYDYKYILLAVLLSLLCIIFSVITSLRSVLNEETIDLLKGKKEIFGNKILLEYITVIWKRISFKNKITLRNIFRYKKRMIMSIVGISGCVSLMFLGFSIKESYSKIVDESQKIRKIDYKIMYNSDIKEIEDKLSNNQFTSLYTEVKDVENEEKNKVVKNVEINLLNENTDILGVNFVDTNGQEVKLDDDGVFVTVRMSEFLGIKEEDSIKIGDKVVKVKKILENYIGNYIYATKKYLGEDKENNTLLVIGNIDVNEMYKIKGVSSIFDENIYVQPIINVSNNLNTIIFVISLLSISLSLVVSLNLMSINISERKKEISTLKVLGFYDYESTFYIYKEIIIINIISLFFGYLGGYYLIRNIINTLKNSTLVMVEKLSYKPFLYTAILMILFTISIGLILDYIISKINMVEALKIDE